MEKPDGLQLIAEERARQVASGYDATRDDTDDRGQILTGAIAYASVALHQQMGNDTSESRELLRMIYWHYPAEEWKPSGNSIRNLVKAGAMIAAEIERIQRLEE